MNLENHRNLPFGSDSRRSYCMVSEYAIYMDFVKSIN